MVCSLQVQERTSGGADVSRLKYSLRVNGSRVTVVSIHTCRLLSHNCLVALCFEIFAERLRKYRKTM